MRILPAFIAACFCASVAHAEPPPTGAVIEIVTPVIICTAQDDVLVIASAVKNSGAQGISATLPGLTKQNKCFGVPRIPFPLQVGEVQPISRFNAGATTKAMYAVEVWKAGEPAVKVWLLLFEDLGTGA